MNLDPKIAEKLMSDVPEMREFISFVNEEANKLNKLDDIDFDLPIPMAIEVKARKKAYQLLKDILDPLIFRQENAIISDASEFNV